MCLINWLFEILESKIYTGLKIFWKDKVFKVFYSPFGLRLWSASNTSLIFMVVTKYERIQNYKASRGEKYMKRNEKIQEREAKVT